MFGRTAEATAVSIKRKPAGRLRTSKSSCGTPPSAKTSEGTVVPLLSPLEGGNLR
ncbi:MAG: hypothetical protein ACTS4V_00585 [Candidatus Hodgkinia cicadicola]